MGVYAVLATSGFSIICAGLRLQALNTFQDPDDPPWDLPVVPFLSALEVYIALMTSSIPAMYPLLVKPNFNFRNPNTLAYIQPDEKWQSNVDTLASSGMANGATKWSFERWRGRIAPTDELDPMDLPRVDQNIGVQDISIPSFRRPSTNPSSINPNRDTTESLAV